MTDDEPSGSRSWKELDGDEHRTPSRSRIHIGRCTVRSGPGGGEHPGRARNPVVKVAGPGLAGVREAGPGAGGAVPGRLRLHGRRPDPGGAGAARPWAGTPSLVVRRGVSSRFVGPTFTADARADLDRLARAADSVVTPHRGGHAVDLTDPSGFPVRVVHGVPELPALPERAAVGVELRPRRGARQRHPATRPAGGADPAARARGAGDHPVPREPRLVPGQPRNDRQRLPLPRRAARARAVDGVYPLRPGQRPVRPPHARHGPAAADRLPALGLPGDGPRRGGGRRASTCASAATGTPGVSAGTSRAARSSTTGATRTG